MKNKNDLSVMDMMGVDKNINDIIHKIKAKCSISVIKPQK